MATSASKRPPTTRYTHAKKILGEEVCQRLGEVKVLLVGAGGIGCELLKNIVLTGFGDITLLDLDTIDLSNLNRQFLFRKKDIKQSKAMVAAKTASAFNPSVRIKPIHANIKESEYDVTWYKGFDIVLNALDNLDARRHVNKMCLAAGVPLVESGTAGYLGQVQPIVKGRTECFDCLPKPVPRTFPVCTIRSTPSQPIHCIVWAKSYLIPQIFGEDENGADELDEAEKAGENAQEIANLRKEAQAFATVRKALRSDLQNGSSPSGSFDPARQAFEKVFNADIKNLLSMEDMWKNRSPPTPLDFEKIADGSFVAPKCVATDNGTTDKKAGVSNGAPPHSKSSGLKDQKELSLQESLILFVSSTHRLAARLRAGEETISFDKDDDDTLDFVTAASNLRSAAYGIPGKSRWEVKEMAGNIIPAIATTNAIIAGIIVLQALHLIRENFECLRNVHLQRKATVPLNASAVEKPSPQCGVCRDVYVELPCDPEKVTLSEVIKGILGPGGTDGGTGPRDVGVYEDARLLADADFDDNLDRTLASLGVTFGKFLTITDEDEELGNVAVAITRLPPSLPDKETAYILPSPLPIPPKKGYMKKVTFATSAVTIPNTPQKRPHEVDLADTERPSKRPKTNNPDNTIKSPSKRKKLEEEGLLIIEDFAEKIDLDDSDLDDDEGPELIAIDDD